jgi:hypothetical protein
MVPEQDLVVRTRLEGSGKCVYACALYFGCMFMYLSMRACVCESVFVCRCVCV